MMSSNQGSTPGSRSLPRLTTALIYVLLSAVIAAPFKLSGPVIFATAILLLIQCLLSRIPLKLPLIAAAFFVWCLCSLMWSVSPADTIRGLAITLLICLLSYSLAAALGFQRVMDMCALCALFLCAVGWIVYVAVPEVGREQVLYQNGAYKGIFIQRNNAALTSSFLTIWMFYGLISRRGSNISRRLLGVGFLLGVATLLASRSGTGLVTTVVALTVLLGLFGFRRSASGVKYLMMVALASVAAAAATSYNFSSDSAEIGQLLGRDATLTGRTFIWQTISPYLNAEPWLGYGWQALWTPGVFMTEQMWARTGFQFPHAHNAYLDFMMQVGRVGLVIWLIFVARYMLRALGRFIISEEAWPAVVLALAVWVLVYASTEQSFAGYFGLMLLVLLSAARSASVQQTAHEPVDEKNARRSDIGSTMR